ncbi:BglG family transcription antiterminator [Alkalihalobacillus oceani]|uniref:Ascorbate-specific PTS system EIIA component n=1 Tax=Halalkalibacter oceani TaxID=1653776 RepID=A0A9X2DP94_9BACI|nr:BglG family transcription antiterminator [Halalkalibacter oceani]MCM3714136.1 BglG family transcription antiterminator [Halalkalibacter oceani]
MALNERSQKILNELARNPNVTSALLVKKYQLSRRQLGYTIKQINAWLKEEELPEIERTRQGHFVVDHSVFAKINREHVPGEQETVQFLTEEQRVYLILLMLISSKEELSLLHFHSELGYSKNTILSDLKQVHHYAGEYGLSVRYSRKSGYLLEGNELHIRRLLVRVTNFIFGIHSGKKLFMATASIEQAEIDQLNKQIEKVESELAIKFTDEKLQVMPYVFLLVLRRIENGCLLEPFPDCYQELAETREYEATKEIFRSGSEAPIQERLFITLHLLTSNIHWSEVKGDPVIPQLQAAIADMLRQFEQSACVYFQERELLFKKLLQHIKPAYYRIKYQLAEIDEVKESFSQEYQELLHLVRRSIGPLEKVIGAKMPDVEVMYITMLIGSWMTRQGESIEKKVKAIVVCPQGVSVSRLMFQELSGLFPEFIFLDSLSMREFYEYHLSYDIVFSQTKLETEKPLYLTKTFLGREERQRLKQQVMQDLHGYSPNEINLDYVIDIVRNYTKIEDEKGLKKELGYYLFQNQQQVAAIDRGDEKVSLRELIRPGHISLRHSAPSWEDALRLAAEPLVRGGVVEERYVEALVRNPVRDPYIIIAPGLAIPHAAPEEGAREVGMSLLRLQKPVAFTAEEDVQLMIVIAAVDKQQHIRALRQLFKLAASEKDRKRLIEANTVAEIYDMIEMYSSD